MPLIRNFFQVAFCQHMPERFATIEGHIRVPGIGLERASKCAGLMQGVFSNANEINIPPPPTPREPPLQAGSSPIPKNANMVNYISPRYRPSLYRQEPIVMGS